MLTNGTIVGHRYRIVEQIGSGGMAHVYRAINLTNHKAVAIKMLKDEYQNDAEFLRRFEREARAVLHLSHENIVRAYGVGDVDGIPYLVLEYVEGMTLKEIIHQNGPMPPRIAVALAVQVLDALSAAHAAGIIHRDVKPQNVIVMPNGRVKLMDFGIAREVDASTMTFTGTTVLGSVHYLSPEQAKGKPVSIESDLYSTGVMLYEMLTGDVPFDGDTSVSIALKHIEETPVAPIERNPKLPPALSDVVMRALNKDMKSRYASAAEMSADLRHALKNPNGTFARETAAPKSEPTVANEKLHSSRLHGAIRIGILVASIVAIMIGLFLVLRDSYDAESDALEVVPALTDRSIDEAKQKAENFGFGFDILDYEVSDLVPSGSVMLQSPDVGTRAKRGTTIQVIVSLGPAAPIVPALSGMTLDEAKAALDAAGLLLGSVEYRISDVKIGYVCAQSLTAGTETVQGETVDVCISATVEEPFEMPNVMDMPLNLSLDHLREKALNNIFVRYAASDSFEDGLVFLQDPLTAIQIVPETRVTLTVSGKPDLQYTADIAFNLDVATPASKVTVAMAESYNGLDYQRILFETSLEKGERIPVSFTAESETDGMREVICYLNGVEVKRQDYNFVVRGGA